MADYKSKFTGEEIDALLESLGISVVPPIFRKAFDDDSLTFDIVKKCCDEGLIREGQFINAFGYPSHVEALEIYSYGYYITIKGMHLESNGVINTQTYNIQAYDNKVERTISYVNYQLQEASSGGGGPM